VLSGTGGSAVRMIRDWMLPNASLYVLLVGGGGSARCSRFLGARVLGVRLFGWNTTRAEFGDLCLRSAVCRVRVCRSLVVRIEVLYSGLVRQASAGIGDDMSGP